MAVVNYISINDFTYNDFLNINKIIDVVTTILRYVINELIKILQFGTLGMIFCEQIITVIFICFVGASRTKPQHINNIT